MPIRDSNYEGRVLFIIYFLEKGSATRVAPGSLNARYRSSSFGRTIFYSSELRTKSRTHTENKFPTQHQHWAKARTLVGGLPTGSANHRESLARSQGRVLSGGTLPLSWDTFNLPWHWVWWVCASILLSYFFKNSSNKQMHIASS